MENFFDYQRLGSPAYNRGFWKGVQDAVRRRNHRLGITTHSIPVLVPEVSGDECCGYRHGYLTGSDLVHGRG
jgi:hypothetical protein